LHLDTDSRLATLRAIDKDSSLDFLLRNFS
jgi:hypothetical protein